MPVIIASTASLILRTLPKAEAVDWNRLKTALPAFRENPTVANAQAAAQLREVPAADKGGRTCCRRVQCRVTDLAGGGGGLPGGIPCTAQTGGGMTVVLTRRRWQNAGIESLLCAAWRIVLCNLRYLPKSSLPPPINTPMFSRNV